MGRSLPKNLLDGNEVLIAMKAYCDGSGSFERSKFVVLAGVAASEGVWSGFDVEWLQILNNRDPIAPYLHMKELIKGVGAFTDDSGWDDEKRQQLVTDCVMYLQRIDKQLFRIFVCSIDMAKYRELADQDLLLPSPVAILNRFVPTQIFKWYVEHFEQWILREVHYHFDQGEHFKGAFENLVRRRKKLSRISNAWHMVKGVNEYDMRDYPPLQLADLLAWSHHRKLNSDPNAKWGHLHVFTDATLPYTRKDIDADLLDSMVRVGNVAIDYFS